MSSFEYTWRLLSCGFRTGDSRIAPQRGRRIEVAAPVDAVDPGTTSCLGVPQAISSEHLPCAPRGRASLGRQKNHGRMSPARPHRSQVRWQLARRPCTIAKANGVRAVRKPRRAARPRPEVRRISDGDGLYLLFQRPMVDRGGMHSLMPLRFLAASPRELRHSISAFPGGSTAHEGTSCV